MEEAKEEEEVIKFKYSSFRCLTKRPERPECSAVIFICTISINTVIYTFPRSSPWSTVPHLEAR